MLHLSKRAICSVGGQGSTILSKAAPMSAGCIRKTIPYTEDVELLTDGCLQYKNNSYASSNNCYADISKSVYHIS